MQSIVIIPILIFYNVLVSHLNSPGKGNLEGHTAASASVTALLTTPMQTPTPALSQAEAVVVAPELDGGSIEGRVKKKSKSAFSNNAPRGGGTSLFPSRR